MDDRSLAPPLIRTSPLPRLSPAHTPTHTRPSSPPSGWPWMAASRRKCGACCWARWGRR